MIFGWKILKIDSRIENLALSLNFLISKKSLWFPAWLYQIIPEPRSRTELTTR